MADRDPADRLRAPARLRGPAPAAQGLEGVRPRQGLYIGLAQVLALAPGVSRSGITITAGRFLGLDRDSAARVSFLLLAPVTAGAVVYKGYGAARRGSRTESSGPMIVGTLAAAVSGYLAIAGLLALVRRRQLRHLRHLPRAVGSWC